MDRIDLSRISVLLLDLGNVFVRVRMQRAFEHWASTAGVDPAQLAARYRQGPAYARHETGAIDAPQFFDALRPMLGIDIDDAAFERGWNDVFDGIETGVHRALLAARTHRRVFAFSNTNVTHRRHFMARYAHEMAVFEHIFDSSEIGLRKPDVAAFEHVVERIGVAPQRILFFDDLPENVAGARAAGLQAMVVAQPADVVELLAKLR